MRIREIEISNTAPASDRLWLRPVGGGFETLVMANGHWNKVSQASQGGGGGMTEEEKAAIEKAIADAKAMADSAQKTAEDALAKAEEGLVPVTADKVSFETDDANLKDADDVKAAIEKLAIKVWYTKISITSYTATPAAGTYEVGRTVNKPTLSWKTSKTPVKTVVNGVTQTNPSTTSYTMPTDLTNTKTVSLAVTDEAGGKDTKTLTWTFAYGVYVGMATVPTELTQDWIKNTLGGKTLKTTAKGTYTMKGSDTKYWWIATPKAWAVNFSTALGDGGAAKYGDVEDFVNDEGVEVPMTVYRAEQIQSGDMNITIK